MRVTKEVADILNLTFDEAIREHHEYVTPELLLYEIAARDTFREAFENCGGDTDMLRDNLREYMEQNLASDADGSPGGTGGGRGSPRQFWAGSRIWF